MLSRKNCVRLVLQLHLKVFWSTVLSTEFVYLCPDTTLICPPFLCFQLELICYLNFCNSYGVTIIAKDFPSTRHLPKISSDASGAVWVPPERMVELVKQSSLDVNQAGETAMDQTLKVLSS